MKRFVRYLGPNLTQNQKLEKWGTFFVSVNYDRSGNLCCKNFHIFIMIWQVYHKNSRTVLNVFIEKKFDKFVQKLQILCNAEVLIFTIFHYTIVIQTSIATSQIHY